MNIGHTSEIRRSRRLTIKIIVTPILYPALHTDTGAQTCIGRRAESGPGRSPKLCVFCVLFLYYCVINSHFLDRLLPLLRRVLRRVGQHGGVGQWGDFGGRVRSFYIRVLSNTWTGWWRLTYPEIDFFLLLLLFTYIKVRGGRGRKGNQTIGRKSPTLFGGPWSNLVVVWEEGTKTEEGGGRRKKKFPRRREASPNSHRMLLKCHKIPHKTATCEHVDATTATLVLRRKK